MPIATAVAVGVLALAAYLTHGFGLLAGSGGEGPEKPALVRQGEKIFVPEDSPLRKRLTVAAAATEPVPGKLVLPAIVESDPARTVNVLPPLGGRIMELKVALGDRVAKGQELVVIDSPDLAQAVDDDEKASDTLGLTERNLARQEAQFKIGAASARDLDQARSDHAQAVAEYKRAQARLVAIGAAAEPRGNRFLVVRAPVAGSVTTLSVAPGNMINDPTQPMMTIADLSTVWVTALVPEKDVVSADQNRDADVAVAAYPDRTLHGKVLFVSDVIEPDSRRDKVRIAFANPDHALKPNMFATVTLVGPEQRRLIVPTSALLMNNDRTSVFVATAPWTFERRMVQPLLTEGTTVPILSGLNAGDQVVVKGGILLND